jgi:hypothetical protein
MTPGGVEDSNRIYLSTILLDITLRVQRSCKIFWGKRIILTVTVKTSETKE